jgi:hypothetical protein
MERLPPISPTHEGSVRAWRIRMGLYAGLRAAQPFVGRNLYA